MPPNDPRVFFAAERTLLAWVRTGLGLIGMGFVVARFGLFLQLFDKQSGAEVSHHVSPWVGVALALLGSAASGVSAWQHRRFCRTLGLEELPRDYRTEVGMLVGFGVAVAGVVLAALLVV
jgi:putative membrane protein